MTSEQFVYWLQGFMEMENPKTLDLRKTKIVKDHLKLVFDKKTPNRDGYSNGIDDKNIFIHKAVDEFDSKSNMPKLPVKRYPPGKIC